MTDVPENAPENCPGTQSEKAGKTTACAGCPNQKACSTGLPQVDPDIDLIKERMSSVKHKILVLSGKGGVGKSSVTTSLAYVMSNLTGKDGKPLNVGVLDIDICGPSQARMFGCENESVHSSEEGWAPVFVKDNLFLMSISFLVESRNDAIIWRGPRKNALIKQFLRDVDWGNVDFLLIDTPPGTSDEHISVVQLLLQASQLDGALIVTTPQEISLLDVRKEVNFCIKTKVPILGVIENMSEFICPNCSTHSQLFPSTTGGALGMCKELDGGLELLASLPLDPKLGKSLDQGNAGKFFEKLEDSVVHKEFEKLAKTILKKCENEEGDEEKLENGTISKEELKE
uniref:Cytosolic Fe-S cluster assembly factor NUBP1 homolog n=1 Tax=Meloidogyne hapla TaxID=6305 RepID=A0A1I8BRF4_MELHA